MGFAMRRIRCTSKVGARPAGLRAQCHRHTAAHTIVVLEGRLEANLVGRDCVFHRHQVVVRKYHERSAANAAQLRPL